ncbi:RNA-binding KH domain-containing protein [Quillaja saponaria]|uniref:RNA-binding KH domain-containing protein n=1 Tax=Quillaja saponaria TaxID=32244 RepID=A0AAD7VKR5_QUISA|nr:RNA-binding KH domain-containing protein [Quillaja saponaria]
MASVEHIENCIVKASESESQTVTSDAVEPATTATITTDATTVNSTEVQSSNPNPDSEESPAADYAAPSATPTANALNSTPPEKKWPGWPGDCVFRIIVPVLKVGSIIGRKGELIKKMCEDTRARIRVLDGAVGTPDRIVLVTGKEEPDAPVSPAMDAVIRAINLIGKQGSLIKSIQESTGSSARVLSGDEVPFYAAADERIVELQGEALKVLKALEAVVSHLRKFLVDHSVLPLFEKTYNATISQDTQVETWADKSSQHAVSHTGVGADYPLSTKREFLFFDREAQLESQLTSSGSSLYGQDSTLSSFRFAGLSRASAPIVTQVAQTIQVPLSYAEDIIGFQGSNIAYIRRTSGATLTVQESNVHDEITVEIKGTSSQVQMAQQLIQEAISNPKEPVSSSYGRLDVGLRSSYPQLGSKSYPSSSLSSQSYTGYGSPGLGGYSTFRF